MKITDALLGEHGVFYSQFNQLEQVVPTLTDVALIQTSAALLAAGLASHAHLENELLFKALEPHLGTGMGPLAVMRMEHNEIETNLARMPEVKAVDEARELVLHIVEVARQHFAKEENILYPAARQVLDEETLTQLGLQWAQQRHVTLA